MWTFAFSEIDSSEIARSIVYSLGQAFHLVNQMNEICDRRYRCRIGNPFAVVALAAELRSNARNSAASQFAMELRVIKRKGGSLTMELNENGKWRTPSIMRDRVISDKLVTGVRGIARVLTLK